MAIGTEMFSFMKKDKTEKRDKKERKDGKKSLTKDPAGVAGGTGAAVGGLSHSHSGAGLASAAAAGPASASPFNKLTADELLRLDEVRRSLKIRTRRKEKEKLPSGITADYTANFNLGAGVGGGAGGADADADDGADQLNSSSPMSGSNSETSLNSLSRDLSQVSHATMTSLPVASSVSSTSASASVSVPTLAPPSRGILKGKPSC